MKPYATIAKRFTFDAAHMLGHLPNDHPCSRLHGHTYGLELVLTGPVNPKTGFVVDYADIATAYNERVHSVLDHRFLNEVEDLAVSSTEILAMWCFSRLVSHPLLGHGWQLADPQRPGRGWHELVGDVVVYTMLQRVRVMESSTTWCEVDHQQWFAQEVTNNIGLWRPTL